MPIAAIIESKSTHRPNQRVRALGAGEQLTDAAGNPIGGVVSEVAYNFAVAPGAPSVTTFDLQDILPGSMILRGRLYLRADPGLDFDAEVRTTFYSRARMRGEDAFYRSRMRIVRTTLAAPITIGDDTFYVNNAARFPVDRLGYVFGNVDEYFRVGTALGDSAGTLIAEDLFEAVHPTGSGVVTVPEFGGFGFFNEEGGTAVSLVLYFDVVTFPLNMRLELVSA